MRLSRMRLSRMRLSRTVVARCRRNLSTSQLLNNTACADSRRYRLASLLPIRFTLAAHEYSCGVMLFAAALSMRREPFFMSTIAFLGAGAMGEALMRGLIEARIYAPQEIVAFDLAAQRLQEIGAALDVCVATSGEEGVRDADVVLLAVKPQAVADTLEPLRETLGAHQTLISIAAGVSTARLESFFAQDVPCVRVMPNTPCLIGKAASAICAGKNADESHVAQAHRIFDSVGIALDVPETMLDAVTGLSGSGPAYVYVFIEALSDAGVKMGLPRDVATRLAAQTVSGAAQMILETGQHPGALKDAVSSPAGTTIAGLHALETGAFRGVVMNAVEAATQRSRELGAK